MVNNANGMNGKNKNTVTQNFFEKLTPEFKQTITTCYKEENDKTLLQTGLVIALASLLTGLVTSVVATAIVIPLIIIAQLIVRYKGLSWLCSVVETKIKPNPTRTNMLSKIRGLEVFLQKSVFNVFRGENNATKITKIAIEIIVIACVITIATMVVTLLLGTIFTTAGTSLLAYSLNKRAEKNIPEFETEHNKFVDDIKLNMYDPENKIVACIGGARGGYSGQKFKEDNYLSFINEQKSSNNDTQIIGLQEPVRKLKTSPGCKVHANLFGGSMNPGPDEIVPFFIQALGGQPNNNAVLNDNESDAIGSSPAGGNTTLPSSCQCLMRVYYLNMGPAGIGTSDYISRSFIFSNKQAAQDYLTAYATKCSQLLKDYKDSDPSLNSLEQVKHIISKQEQAEEKK